MKKWIAAFACIVFLLTLAACQQEEDSIRKRRKNTTKETVVTTAETTVETTAETEPEMTLEEFLVLTEGIWIQKDSINDMGGGQCSFSALVIGKEYICSAWYPGEYDRAGTIDGFEILGDNIYKIPLVFEAGEHMGDYYPESTSAVTFSFMDDGQLKVEYDSGYTAVLVYGGRDFDEANKTACGL